MSGRKRQKEQHEEEESRPSTPESGELTEEEGERSAEEDDGNNINQQEVSRRSTQSGKRKANDGDKVTQPKRARRPSDPREGESRGRQVREASDGKVTIVIKSQAPPQASSSTAAGVLASITQHPPNQPIPRRAAPGAAPTQERDTPNVGRTDEAGGLYKCGWCDKKYTTAFSMRRHIRSFHEQGTFRCRHCNAEY